MMFMIMMMRGGKVFRVLGRYVAFFGKLGN